MSHGYKDIKDGEHTMADARRRVWFEHLKPNKKKLLASGRDAVLDVHVFFSARRF